LWSIEARKLALVPGGAYFCYLYACMLGWRDFLTTHNAVGILHALVPCSLIVEIVFPILSLFVCALLTRFYHNSHLTGGALSFMVFSCLCIKYHSKTTTACSAV